jgi:hypothetical protein
VRVRARLKSAGAHRRDDTTVHQQIAAGDERTIGTHQVRGRRANFIRGAATACGGDLHHLALARPACRVELVHRQRSEDDAGADRVDPGTPVAPLHRGGLYAQRVGPLGDCVSSAGVRQALKERKMHQLLRRGARERFILLWCESSSQDLGRETDIRHAKEEGVLRSDFDSTDAIFIQVALAAVMDKTRGISPVLYRRYLMIFLDGICADKGALSELSVQPLSIDQTHLSMAPDQPRGFGSSP